MKLVTYLHKGKQRAGAFIDGDRKIVDLADAHKEAFDDKYKGFASVLTMIEAGDEALDRAYETLKKNKKKNAIDRKSVKLLAPIQPPPQIRDCLCFEQHLQQAFAAARQVRANAMPDPKKALAEFERNGTLQVPKTFTNSRSTTKPIASR